MKYIILALCLIGCGQEVEVAPEPVEVEEIVFQLPPAVCEITVPGAPPVVIVVPWGEADEMEASSPFIECRNGDEE